MDSAPGRRQQRSGPEGPDARLPLACTAIDVRPQSAEAPRSRPHWLLALALPFSRSDRARTHGCWCRVPRARHCSLPDSPALRAPNRRPVASGNGDVYQAERARPRQRVRARTAARTCTGHRPTSRRGDPPRTHHRQRPIGCDRDADPGSPAGPPGRGRPVVEPARPRSPSPGRPRRSAGRCRGPGTAWPARCTGRGPRWARPAGRPASPSRPPIGATGPEQHGAGRPLGPADHVGAPVHAVGEVHVELARQGRTWWRCGRSAPGRRGRPGRPRPGRPRPRRSGPTRPSR